MLLQEYVAGLAYDLLQLDETLASAQQDKVRFFVMIDNNLNEYI